MKHLHLITGLLVSVAMAGCGDYGDDGAVNSTGGNSSDNSRTNFTLAVAEPVFGPAGGGSKPRLRAEDGKITPIAQAVTGSAPVTTLQRDDVRAFVVVPDSSSARGYREVSIDVDAFEHLGNGRYRIAIDGQAQVDGFFEITINGVVFKVALARTGTTDAPIDVNALQSALADRLQALLVANEVCSAVTVTQLNDIFTAGRSYMDGLTVPDDIRDVGALIEFYRVSVSSYIQEQVAERCAPALEGVAVQQLVGDYHALNSGLSAFYEVANVPVLQTFSTLLAEKSLSLSETTPGGTFSGDILRDNRFRSTVTGGNTSVFEDNSRSGVSIGSVSYPLSFAAFANDATRALVKNGETASVEPLDGTPFTPGFVVTRVPAWTQYPLGGSLFGASQQTLLVYDLTSASDACLTAISLNRNNLLNRGSFNEAAQESISDLGQQQFANVLAASCGVGVAVGYGASLHVDTQRASDFGVTDMEGRFGVVSLESDLLAGNTASVTGIAGFSSDAIFDIDGEGVLVAAPAGGSITQFNVASSLVAGGANVLTGRHEQNVNDDESVRIDVPLDVTQNPASTGELFLEIDRGSNTETHSGFASAAGDLFAFGVASVEEGTSVGTGTGGFFVSGQMAGEFFVGTMATQGNHVYATAGGDGLKVISIEDPNRPVEVATYFPTGQQQPQMVVVSGNYAYVSLGEGGLDIVNIETPAEPSRAGLLGSPLQNLGIIQASGTLVFGAETTTVVSSFSSILRVIDASTPSAPALIGSLDLSTLNAGEADYVTAMAAVGNRLYVLSETPNGVDRMHIIDVAVSQGTATLTSLNVLTLGDSGASDIKVVGNLVYVLMDSFGLAIYDASIPADIQNVSTVELSQDTQSLWVGTNAAFATYSSEGPAGILMIDISTPASPVLVGDLELDYASQIVGSGDHLYASTGSYLANVLAVDVTSPPVQTQIDSIPSQFGIQDMAIVGTNLVTVGGGGLRIYDLTNPAQPQDTGSVALPGTGYSVAVSGSRAFVADSDSGLDIFDISNPQDPQAQTGLPLAAETSDVAVAGDFAYVTDFSAGLQIVNVAGATPVLAQTVSTSSSARAVAISGTNAFIANGNGLEVISNIQTPGNLAVVANAEGVSQARDVVIGGNYAYVADGSNGGVAIYNITEPTSMVLTARTATWAYIDRLVLSGSTLFAFQDEGDVSVIDVSNPASPLGIARIARDYQVNPAGALFGSYFFSTGFDPGTESERLITHSLQGSTSSVEASNGLVLGVRIDQGAPAVSSLVGKQFTLSGQQAAQSIVGETTSAGLGIIAGGSLRFVQVGGNVQPIFDLPLSSVVITDFSGLTPRLSLQFSQWTTSAVVVDANGRVTFDATDAVSGTTARFAAYLGDNGLLLGRFDALAPRPADAADGVIEYPGLTRAAEGIFVGVPREVPPPSTPRPLL